jgi:hypothetical protein
MLRYADWAKNNCTGASKCEAIARMHNGGADGCTKPVADAFTNEYWRIVKACYEQGINLDDIEG